MQLDPELSQLVTRRRGDLATPNHLSKVQAREV
jgi:hypothetical protein